MSAPVDRREQILIYDAECRLCVTAKQGLESCRRPPALRFVAYQSEEAARYLGENRRAGRPDAAFLIGADGGILVGLDAFLPLLPGLPGGRFLAVLARWPLFRTLAERAYRLVAARRYQWFGAVTDPHSLAPSPPTSPPTGG
jgi:predicted DCC family thiol-disulfide oxidoreductase YuxK